MADYQRFISYMYLYEGEVKGRNTGFVKVETRGCYRRMEAMIRRQPLFDGLASVWVFYRQDGYCKGILLGRMTISGGNGNFSWSSLKETVEESDCRFEDLAGVLIWSQRSSNLCVTLWDDLPFSIGMFVPEDKIVHVAQVEESVQEIVSKQKEDADEMVEMEEIEEVAEVSFEDEENVREEGTFIESECYADDLVTEENLSMAHEKSRWEHIMYDSLEDSKEETPESVEPENTEAGNQDEVESNSSEKVEEVEEIEYMESVESGEETDEEWEQEVKRELDSLGKEQQRELNSSREFDVDLERFFQKGSPWEQLCGMYPKIKPFAWNRELYCLKIKPGDLGHLPKENWILGNNSFMLHGYYVHRYLILMEQKQSDSVRYILGVPGIYGNRERMMADMFGFGEFVPMDSKRSTNGQKGFWCVNVTV